VEEPRERARDGLGVEQPTEHTEQRSCQGSAAKTDSKRRQRQDRYGRRRW
jgi:hypothetical protein